MRLQSDASDQEIRKAYKNLAKIHHPDRNHNDPNAHKNFIILSKAYNCIRDHKSRQKCLYNKESQDEFQGYQVGIAFPAFILEKRNQYLILSIFFIFIIFLLPVLIYRVY